MGRNFPQRKRVRKVRGGLNRERKMTSGPYDPDPAHKFSQDSGREEQVRTKRELLITKQMQEGETS